MACFSKESLNLCLSWGHWRRQHLCPPGLQCVPGVLETDVPQMTQCATLHRLHSALQRQGSVLSELACERLHAGNMADSRLAFTMEMFWVYLLRWKLSCLICTVQCLNFFSFEDSLFLVMIIVDLTICLGFHCFPPGQTLMLWIMVPVITELFKMLCLYHAESRSFYFLQ